MRYVLKVAYDGTHFCGWQVQANGRTVQEELNRAVYAAFGESSTVTASGRTDAGVHALGQVCHLDLSKKLAGGKLADALNTRLPADVSVLQSALAPEGFDSNRSAKKKTYTYSFYISERRNPLKERYAVRLRRAPDIKKLEECASLFIGEHDFKAYCASGSKVQTTVRTVYSIDIKLEEGALDISVCGSGFLYNMVRTLCGTLLYCAEGKISKQQVLSSINEGDRSKVGKTLPAKGLTLLSVDYGAPLF